MKIKNMGIAAAIIFFLLSFTSTAFAQLSVSITVKNPDPYNGNQSWFIYEKKPGDTINDVASIKNYGSTAMNVHICAIDGTTNKSGSFVLKFDYEKQGGIGAWATVQKKEFTIKPGERMDIPFKIIIPKDTQPGQYLGGIVVENQEFHMLHNNEYGNSTSESKPNTSYGQAMVSTRIGARIYITIPGEVKEAARVDDFEFKQIINQKSYFKFKISNTGNVAFAPTARIKIFDQTGNLYDTIEKPLGTSAPNTVIEPIVYWEKRPIIGQFTAKADVTFKRIFEPAGGLHGSPVVFNTSAQFTIVPWSSFILLFFMTILVVSWFINRKCKLAAYIHASKKYQVTTADDLKSIADDFNVPWQLIARLNKLKPPYSVKAGDSLIIPRLLKKINNEKK